MPDVNLDLGLAYTGGINKPTTDQVGYFARVDSTGVNLEYVELDGFVTAILTEGSYATEAFATAAAQLPANVLIALAGAEADIDVNGQKITNLAEPVNASDAATKDYVDNNGGGSVDEASVRAALAASTGPVDVNGQAVTGVADVAADTGTVASSLMPVLSATDEVADEGTLTCDTSEIPASTHAKVVFQVIVCNADDDLLYERTILCRAMRSASDALASFKMTVVEDPDFNVSGHAFTAALEGNTIRATYTNTTGGSVDVRIVGHVTLTDAP